MRKLVLWGHNVQDYQKMFNLSTDEINHSKILEFGCGPSAVNAPSRSIVSCDPLFKQNNAELAASVQSSFADRVAQIKREKTPFDLSEAGSLEQLLAARQQGIDAFFADYASGKEEGRYIGSDGEDLPFSDFYFDFALVSHYLFADIEEQNVESHVRLIQELARVAKDVRIFPISDVLGRASQFLGPVLLSLQQAKYGVEVREVDFHLYRHGNAMLRVWAQQCSV